MFQNITYCILIVFRLCKCVSAGYGPGQQDPGYVYMHVISAAFVPVSTRASVFFAPSNSQPLYNHSRNDEEDDETHGFDLALGESSERWPNSVTTVSTFVVET